jgi:Na+/H+ antiporter
MFPQILLVIIGALAVTIYSERRGFQAPLVVVIISLLISFVPGIPRFEIPPEIILTIVLPPLLYSTTIDLPFSSFMRRLGSIMNLGVFLVVVTTGVVGFIAAQVVPGLSVATALVLAAVISPPDAVTAVAIGRQLGLPKRVMTILTGESLINDAAALTLYSATVAVVVGSTMFIENLALYFVYSAFVGIIVGVGIGWVVHHIRINLTNPTLMTVLSLITPFAAYLAAEEFHASGVIAVVAAGFTLGSNSSGIAYTSRIQERLLWPVIDMLLESIVFAYIGLQLQFIIREAENDGYELGSLLGAAFIVLFAVIAIRIVWVFATRLRHRSPLWKKIQDRRFKKVEPLTWQESLVISWTGMRGVVTLAAAAGIPFVTNTGAAFPGRSAIQVVAFVVAVGTLLIHSLTLPWLISKLQVADPYEHEREIIQSQRAHQIVFETARRVASDFIENAESSQEREIERQWLKQTQSTHQWKTDTGRLIIDEGKRREIALHIAQLRQRVLVEQRQALQAERDAERIDDETLREILEELDLQEALLQRQLDRVVPHS